jgi:hypothetical protein
MKSKLASYISLIAISTIVILVGESCKKFVDIPTSPNLVQTDLLFETEGGIVSAVNGVYAQLRAFTPSYANGTFSIYCGLSSDELVSQANESEYDAFYANAILPTSDVVHSQIWSAAYRLIYRTNSVIFNLEKSTGISNEKRNMYLGEMYTIRAFTYFYLLNIFGDVPLIVSTNYLENDKKARTSQSEIYAFLIADLVKSVDYLNENYPVSNKARMNKYAACALLARIYLYTEEWEKAEFYSSLILSSGKYNLENELDNTFRLSSPETIWQIAPLNGFFNTAEGSIFIPYANDIIPQITISTQLLAAFETNDNRKAKWIGASTINGTPYFYPFKYKNRAFAPVDEYIIVFRLAEQLLIRSEARLKQNKIQAALEDLNLIRVRAGLQPVQSNNSEEIFSSIVKERQLELFAEWGHRWFDLKRLNTIHTILSAVKGSNWQETDQLFPIPFSEIQMNTSLEQNPGY